MPRLRVLAGESPQSLQPITANKSGGYKIKTSTFDGEISVFLKNFTNEKGESSTTDYFDHPDRKGCTWSIQARGRFLKNLSGDDVLFGNVFDRPISLPYGSGAAIKFMHMADPTLEDDLYGDKPWALSPLITTMPHLSVTDDKESSKGSSTIVKENTNSVVPDDQTRRAHFRAAENRQKFLFGPDQYTECDFCHGMLSFENGLSLSFPVVHFDLMQYWDGRPVWFVCCERGQDGKGPGPSIWCVGFEILEENGDTEDSKKPKVVKAVLERLSRDSDVD